jgi:hypothetical protein
MADGCRGTTKDGNPCAARPMPGRDVCPWHAPDLAQRRQEWSAKGGQQRSSQARAKKHLPTQLLSNEELISYLTVVFKGVIAGKVEPKVGTAAAAIAKTMTDIATAGAIDELEAEVETLKVALRRGGVA